jgi:hypothetical protein
MRAKEYLDLVPNIHLFDDGTLESLRCSPCEPQHVGRASPVV